jgi:hypothetical protein
MLTPDDFVFGQRGRFGLSEDQMRAGRFVQNAGWFNQHGQRCGYGDLSVEDMQRIASELEDGEIFVVLSEYHWRTRLFSAFTDAERKAMGPGHCNMGFFYVADHCQYIIRKGEILAVANDKGAYLPCQHWAAELPGGRYVSLAEARLVLKVHCIKATA